MEKGKCVSFATNEKTIENREQELVEKIKQLTKDRDILKERVNHILGDGWERKFGFGR